jgi:hypothetical protein
MEIAVGFHSLTTTTHPPNVNLPSSGQEVTARLSARKVSVAGAEQGPRPPGQGHHKRESHVGLIKLWENIKHFLSQTMEEHYISRRGIWHLEHGMFTRGCCGCY